MKSWMAATLLSALVWGAALPGCEAPVDEVVGTSISGNIIGVAALYGTAGLRADDISQATIRVEVFNTSGQPVDGAAVTLTATLGTLGTTALTTANGVAVTTFTSGTVTGTAFVVATVENVSATAAIPIVKF